MADYTTARSEKGLSTLKITNATAHNLQNLNVEIPLNRFVCITGVSGSGKTTLVRDILLPAAKASMAASIRGGSLSGSPALDPPEAEDEAELAGDKISGSPRLTGAENLADIVMVDQSSLGKTPRSNPAVFIGAFEDIRALFASSEPAKQRGLDAGAFSFNSTTGQCERCKGAGYEKIEMQFLSDVFIKCPDCDGARYRQHILEVKIAPPQTEGSQTSVAVEPSARSKTLQGALKPERGSAITKVSRIGERVPSLASSEEERGGVRRLPARFPINSTPAPEPPRSIADLLDSTIEESIQFLGSFTDSRPARRATESLKLLEEVGLGYLKLGQPINTLSGGESQRLKLVRRLAESRLNETAASSDENGLNRLPAAKRSILFLFDEPTTGLHFEDVRILLEVFQRLVDEGHSILVIEHNLDVIRSADWVIDMGPDAGEDGGQIVVQGTPETIADCPESHTGKALSQTFRSTKQYALA
jgi:excinuclease ABC subunit A